MLARLGLIIREATLEKKEEFTDFSTGSPKRVLATVCTRQEILLDLQMLLHPDALMTLEMVRNEWGGQDVALHLDHLDSTYNQAKSQIEELAPVIIETWRSQNGDFTHRAAMMLGMLLMEMLWGMAS